MQEYPKKKSRDYTANLGLRCEEELTEEFKELRKIVDEDVSEAMRIELRKLAKRLRDKYENKQAS